MNDTQKEITDWFGEKQTQVETGSVKAFGIDISSRYGDANELIVMLYFCREAAIAKVAHYVSLVFYDSKGCICSFELVDSVMIGDPVEIILHDCAERAFIRHGGQYVWIDGQVWPDEPYGDETIDGG
ncbi:MAG: hypothetical protein H7839_14875 [Magnetococcus sp. YQC-5]